ncbi:TcpQ domain-containing protein [Ottowia sp.]|uniref:TcpQ domain-containing protein n=1 Tax=Ottowia sp. TaxID=1898956 RepID=UPI003A8B80D2
MAEKMGCRARSGRWFGISVALVVLQACESPPPKPPDFGEDWKPINVLAEEPMQIPLKEEQALWTYQMLPTDVTLRGMLERWATEHGGKLEWQYPTDLTLVSALSSVKDNNIQKALNVVRHTYEKQKLRVRVLSNKNLLVTQRP